MNILDIIKNRRSIRSFDNKVVDNKLIEKIINAARWAPSACNLQHWLFITIRNKNAKERIVKEGKAQNQLINSPVIIAVFCNKANSIENYANIQSCAAAIQNMLLMSHSLGLGTNWVAGFEKPEIIRKMLNVPKKYKLIAFVMVGWPKKGVKIKAPEREAIQNILHYEEYSLNKSDFPDNINLKNWTLKQIINYQNKISRRGFELENIKQDKINEIFEYIKPQIKGEKILDLYPYGSYFLSKLQELKDKRIFGLYLSKPIIDSALIHNKSLENKNLKTIQDKDFEKNKFETITSFYTLEHMPKKEDLIFEINKKLKNNGRLIIITRNKYSWRGVWDFINKNIRRKNGIDNSYFCSLHHIGPWELSKRSKIKKLLNKQGFKKIRIKGKFILPTSEIKNTVTINKFYRLKVIFKIFSLIDKVAEKIKLANLFGETLIIVADKQ